MEYKKSYDFVGAGVFIVLGLCAAAESAAIHRETGGALYVSPGFTPLLLSVALAFCGALLLGQSMRGGGFPQRMREFRGRLGALRGKNARTLATGIAILFVYSCVLVRLLPFAAASFLFLAALMAYLRAMSLLKILIVSALAVLAIVVFFEVGFHVPLP